MRSDQSPCIVCKRPTTHKSGKCQECRTTKCVECGKMFASQVASKKCAMCKKYKNTDMSADYLGNFA